MDPRARCPNRGGFRWLRLLALALLGPLAGCAAMNLLEGKMPVGDDEDIGIVTTPYPGWEHQAKNTLDRIPSTGAKQQAASVSPTAAATPAAAAQKAIPSPVS